ncbi:MAG TPA: hypothetical protein PLV92_12880, partial [Pirellulaceae bacterium]|nr:hypothetical protein [Pirellulaceae bacterium]
NTSSAAIYLGGRVFSHGGATLWIGDVGTTNLSGGTNVGGTTSPEWDLTVDVTGSIETSDGSLVVTGGHRAKIDGAIVVRGATAEVSLVGFDSLDVHGRIAAGQRLALGADGPAATGSSLNVAAGARLDSLGGAEISLASGADLVVDGLIGRQFAPSSLSLSTATGSVNVGATAILESQSMVLVEGRAVEFRGALRTTGSTTSTTDAEVTVRATGAAAADTVALSGQFDVAGTVSVESNSDVRFTDFVAIQSGADNGWTVVADGDVLFGDVEQKPSGAYRSLAVRMQAERFFNVTSGGDIDLVGGSRLAISGADGQLTATAEGRVVLVGSIFGGGSFNSAGELTWTGGDADISITGESIEVGGLAPNAGGTLVTTGGTLRATGGVALTAIGADAASDLSINSFSLIETAPADAVAAHISNNWASSIALSAQDTLSIYGLVTARDDGGDIHLHGGDSIRVDGVVDAGDALTMTGGGEFGATVGFTLTPLLVQTDSAGRVIDDQGRLIDDQGRLVDVNGTFVDENGDPLPAGADPMYGGAPVRLSGGAIEGRSIVADMTGAAELNGSVGQLRSTATGFVTDLETATFEFTGDVDLGGRIESIGSVDLRGAIVDVASRGAVIGHDSVHLLGESLTHQGYVASDALIVLNAVDSLEITGLVQSGGTIRAQAGVDAAWTTPQLLRGDLTASDMAGGTVSIMHSGVLDAKTAIRLVAGQDVKLAADVVVTPNLTSVSTPQLVTVPRTIDVLVGPQQVFAGTTTSTEVREVTTTVTEQVGTELVRVGSRYETFDVKLTQDGYFNGTTLREYFVQNVDYENETMPWSSYRRLNDGSVVHESVAGGAGDVVDTPELTSTFAQLTDAQRAVVLAELGYMPLYNFSYSNAQTHQTVSGNSTTSAWTPDWANNAPIIVHISYPGLDGLFIRLPDGA